MPSSTIGFVCEGVQSPEDELGPGGRSFLRADYRHLEQGEVVGKVLRM